MFRYLFQRTLFVIFISVSTYAFASFDLDVDDNGETDALTDGLLVLRHMFGLSGDTLALGVVGSEAARSEPDEIESHLSAAGEKLDVDGDGDVDALTDGLLILRDLFGLSGDALVTGVLSDSSERKTSEQVISYLATIKDSDNDDVVDSSDAFPFDSSEALDIDGDGIGNNADLDDDGDGIEDGADAFPLDGTESLDSDGDGIGNNSDADDDNDGIEDGADVFPLDSSQWADEDGDGIGDHNPWINELHLDRNGGISVEIAAPSSLRIRNPTILPDGRAGWDDLIRVDYIGSDGRTLPREEEGFTGVCNDSGGRLDGYEFFGDNINGFGFCTGGGPHVSRVSAISLGVRKSGDGDFWAANLDTSAVSSCIDFVSWNGEITAQTGPCAGKTSIETGLQTFSSGLEEDWKPGLGRKGTGVAKGHFSEWQNITESSMKKANDRQLFIWEPNLLPYENGSLDIAALELPKSRNSVIKNLQESGFVDPPKNDRDLVKAFVVNQVTSEMLVDDDSSTYLFFSPTIRQDFVDYIKASMRELISIFGSVRAENYYYDFDSQATETLIQSVACRRGRKDACDGFENKLQNFPFVGSGGGYRGMNEGSMYLDGALPYRIIDLSVGVDGGRIYTLPSGAEAWGGFANSNISLYPMTFSDPGYVSFTGAVPTGGTADISFRFEFKAYPDVDPAYDTSTITLEGSQKTTYTIEVPSQGNRSFSSLIMYVSPRDTPVLLESVVISSDTNQESTALFTEAFGGATQKIVDDSEADVIDSGMYQPKKNFDVSGRASDLNNVNLLQYYENLGSYREEALSGFVHEYLHNWEAQHIIAGPNTALWKENGQTGAIGPELVHGLWTAAVQQYAYQYLIAHSGNTIWSTQRRFQSYEDVVSKILSAKSNDVDISSAMFTGTQGLQLESGSLADLAFPDLFSLVLLKKYGYAKVVGEYPRRIAASGNWNLATQQTFNRSPRQLYKEIEHYLYNKVTSPSDLLIPDYETREAFEEALGISFNTSLLQLRSDTSGVTEYRTVYTPSEASGVIDLSEQWKPIKFDGSQRQVLREGVSMSLSSSEGGQLMINGHLAYFYDGDSSVNHAAGVLVDGWSGFTRLGDRTSDLFYDFYIRDHDKDGLPDDYDLDFLDRDGDGVLDYEDNDDDNDGTLDINDAFPYDSSETMDSDWDGIGDSVS